MTYIRAWRTPFLVLRQALLPLCQMDLGQERAHDSLTKQMKSDDITATLPYNPPCSQLVSVSNKILPLFLIGFHHSELKKKKAMQNIHMAQCIWKNKLMKPFY